MFPPIQPKPNIMRDVSQFTHGIKWQKLNENCVRAPLPEKYIKSAFIDVEKNRDCYVLSDGGSTWESISRSRNEVEIKVVRQEFDSYCPTVNFTFAIKSNYLHEIPIAIEQITMSVDSLFLSIEINLSKEKCSRIKFSQTTEKVDDSESDEFNDNDEDDDEIDKNSWDDVELTFSDWDEDYNTDLQNHKEYILNRGE